MNRKVFYSPLRWMSGRGIAIITYPRCNSYQPSARCKAWVSRWRKSKRFLTTIPPFHTLNSWNRRLSTANGNLLLSLRDSRKEISTMEKFSIQTLPSIIVASHREVIKNWQALGPLCTDVIGPEMHRLGCRCPMPGYCFTVEHDKEYKPTDIDIEYCEQVEEMGTDSTIIQFKRLPEVPTALCMAHHGPYDRFYESYTEFFRYIEEHGYRVIGEHRTVYVDGIWNQKDPEKWLSILQVPVAKE